MLCRGPDTEGEVSPLLPHEQQSQRHGCSDDSEDSTASLRKPYQRVTILLTVVGFVATLGSGLLTIPTLRVLEDIICQRQLAAAASDGRLGEDKCKGDAVQAELALVVGIQSMVEAIPGLILAVPYGLLADRIGRRPVLALSMAGLIMSLTWMLVLMRLGVLVPIWTIWTSAAWLVIGGGNSVVISMFYSMIADVETVDTRANAFYLVVTGNLFANLLSVPVSAQLMQISPWIPLLGGLILVVLASASLVFMPETLPSIKDAASIPEERDPDMDSGNESLARGIKQQLLHTVVELKGSMNLLRSHAILALVFTFCVQGFVSGASSFTVQYFSKRFHWPLSRAGMLFSVSNLVNIVLHLVILPGLSWMMTSPRLIFRCHPDTKDVILARTSALLLVLGSILLAWPSQPAVICGIIVFTLGLGFPSLCRAIVTTLIDPEHTARVYTLISVVQACSSLASGPVVAWLFGKGLQLGGYWVGLPFFGVTLLCAAAALAIFVVRLPRGS